MTTLQFKTNIKCAGCIAKTTPFLNETVGENNWQVDVQNPDKILTVSTNAEVTEKEVLLALEKAGYTAKKI